MRAQIAPDPIMTTCEPKADRRRICAVGLEDRLADSFCTFIAAGLVVVFVVAAALSVWNRLPGMSRFHLTGGTLNCKPIRASMPITRRSRDCWERCRRSLSDARWQSSPAAWKRRPVQCSKILERSKIACFGRRLTMLTLSVLLGWLLYAWASQLFGPHRAWLPMALYAFCPVLLANAPLITTDVASTHSSSRTTIPGGAISSSRRHIAWRGSAAVRPATAKLQHSYWCLHSRCWSGIAVAAPSVLPFDLVRRLQLSPAGAGNDRDHHVVHVNLVYFLTALFDSPEYLVRAQNLVPTLRVSAEQLARFWPSWLPVPYRSFMPLVPLGAAQRRSKWPLDLLSGSSGLGRVAELLPSAVARQTFDSGLAAHRVGRLRAFSRLPVNGGTSFSSCSRHCC